MSDKDTPNPGSDEAIALGCTCPVMDNNYGKGYMGMEDVFWYSANCPVHQLDEEE